MQSPSSLIFLVLLGIWAAYFVQYWVRRRDHLSTARSVEQFSAAMRVLERREALPGVDLSQPSPPSYAVHPARGARPQVLVKRAVPAEPALVAFAERVEGSARSGSPAASTAPVSAAAPERRTPARPAPAARPRVRPSRRVRGLMFLAALVELLAIAPLTAMGMLPLWALAPAGAAVLLALLWVRSGAWAEQAARRASRRRAAELAHRRSIAPVKGRAAGGSSEVAAGPVTGSPRHEDAPESTPASPADDAAAQAPSVDEPVASELTSTRAVVDTVFDDSAEVAVSAADVMVPILDEDDMPLTWDPVPVPRPTYTMKAKAQRPEVAPAAVTPDPAPAATRDDADDVRRVAGA